MSFVILAAMRVLHTTFDPGERVPKVFFYVITPLSFYRIFLLFVSTGLIK